jgi:hypothetical protein
MPGTLRSSSRRFGVLAVASSVALLAPAVTAGAAAERCCFKATINSRGLLIQDFDQGSDRTIGTATSTWDWTERAILVYEDHSTNPRFSLARAGGAEIRPSSVYFGSAESTVQLKQPDGSYSPRAAPGDCGNVSVKRRRGDPPVFNQRKFALPGPRARYPSARMFLSIGFQVAFDNSDQCLFGGGTVDIEYWDKQACKGSGGFSLPAPRRAWFKSGKGRIEKTASCQASHDEPSNERSEIATGIGTMVLEWFPPNRLDEHVKRLKKAHGNAKSPYDKPPAARR